ncbi:unnamed protein product [Adineta steineri]|uniref:NAD(P)(+)--arginine ADP-ribosyltransferase n=1 Tax=Adineta steineri TaxID=433720 RepID=A0A819DUA2_9BILA|nr:unnamed protein product [Adineta steineri]
MAQSNFIRSERFLDAASEPQSRLSSIHGYELKPLLSLKEAVRPFESLIPNIQAYFSTPTGSCEQPKDGLTPDESAAIYLYTTESLWKLDDVYGLVFRGVKGNISDDYPNGKKFPWWGLSSTTISLDVLQKDTFLGESGPRTLFNIQCFNGKMIKNHSQYPSENEVLLLPCSYFEVMGNMKQGADLRIIHLKQIEPPVVLIQRPFPLIVHPKEPTLIRWAQNGITIAGFHGKGSARNQLCYPQGLCVNDDETIFIADFWNHRILELKKNATVGKVVAGGNGQGNNLNQLDRPTDVILDKETNSLIICDYENKRVMRWLRQEETKSGEILIDNISCWGLIMDDQRYLYVSDRKQHEVRRYQMGSSTGTIVAGGNGRGNRLDQLREPFYVFVDREYSVYVSDTNNHRVMLWKKGADEGIVVAGGRSRGNALTQVSYPEGLFVDDLRRVYVSEGGNNFNRGNNRVTRWCDGIATVIVGGNGMGQKAHQFNVPVGLSFDLHSNLYVVDCWNQRVQRFEIEN